MTRMFLNVQFSSNNNHCKIFHSNERKLNYMNIRMIRLHLELMSFGMIKLDWNATICGKLKMHLVVVSHISTVWYGRISRHVIILIFVVHFVHNWMFSLNCFFLSSNLKLEFAFVRNWNDKIYLIRTFVHRPIVSFCFWALYTHKSTS